MDKGELNAILTAFPFVCYVSILKSVILSADNSSLVQEFYTYLPKGSQNKAKNRRTAILMFLDNANKSLKYTLGHVLKANELTIDNLFETRSTIIQSGGMFPNFRQLRVAFVEEVRSVETFALGLLDAICEPRNIAVLTGVAAVNATTLLSFGNVGVLGLAFAPVAALADRDVLVFLRGLILQRSIVERQRQYVDAVEQVRQYDRQGLQQGYSFQTARQYVQDLQLAEQRLVAAQNTYTEYIQEPIRLSVLREFLRPIGNVYLAALPTNPKAYAYLGQIPVQQGTECPISTEPIQEGEEILAIAYSLGPNLYDRRRIYTLEHIQQAWLTAGRVYDILQNETIYTAERIGWGKATILEQEYSGGKYKKSKKSKKSKTRKQRNQGQQN
jgi:hypothetical protein